MKQITNYIQEGLRINKNTKVNKDQKEIEMKFKKDIVNFPKDDVDVIIEFAESLPIRPTEIEYFPNSNALRLGYRYDNDKSKLQYAIIFGYINTAKGYRVEYMEDYNNGYEEYPKFPKVISLKDAFNYIEKKFDEWIKK